MKRQKNHQLKPGWYALIVSGEAEYPYNYLLGGVKQHLAGPFDSANDAQTWLNQAIETNQGAGRAVDIGHCKIEQY